MVAVIRIWTSRGLLYLAAAIVLLLVVVSVRPSWFTAADPYGMAPIERLQPPSREHFLGTDEVGRDIYARIIYGARLTLSLSLLIVIAAGAIGTTVGMIGGYCGGKVDGIVMRVTDVFLAFPQLILAMVIVASLGQSLLNSTLGLIGIWWAQYARLARARVLVIKEQEYVLSATAMGVGACRMLLYHVLPNGLTPVLVKVAIDIGVAVIMLSALSFVGLGAKPPTPEWGAMITTGRGYLLDYWWVPTFPGLAIFISVIAFNLIGDWVRDRLDPRESF